jgi:predicted NBD/HSP70 family sugar kinase
MTTAVGLDVGGTRVRSMHGTSAVDRIAGVDWPVPRDLGEFLTVVSKIVELAGSDVNRIAIGLPGRTSTRTVDWVPALPYLDHVELSELITERTSAEVVLMNDAQLSLIAEVREGSAIGRTNVALVAIGTGIGGAVMLDGRIVTGATGSLGSFGWMSVPEAGPADPQHGPWERSASGSAFARLAGGHDQALRLMLMAGSGGAIPDLVTAYGRQLGHGFAAIASVWDPELILVSGGVSEDFAVLEPIIRTVMHEQASPTGKRVPISQGALGSRAGVIGAYRMAIEGVA